MCKDLHANHISHGDLQHGNILVDKQGNLKLIDYDSIYVPTFKGESDIIAGLKEYQHPNRKNNTQASEKVDYFSEVIFYLSILAFAENPSLIEKYKIKDADRLLFTADDFINLRNTQVYADLKDCGPIVNVLLQIMEIYLQEHDINRLDPIEIMLDKYTKEPEIESFRCENQSVYKGDEVRFEWVVNNYTDIF